MATFVPFPDGAQVELIFTLGGSVCVNRLWFWTDSPPITPTAIQGLADGVFAWHTTNILPYLSTDLALQYVRASEWSASPPPLTTTAGSPTLGGVGQNSHSANVATFVAFRWPLNLPRRRRNGNFVPGVTLDDVDLNTPTAFIRGVLFEAYAALIDDARRWDPGQFWWWVVTSAFLDNAPRASQDFGKCIGPVNEAKIRLGQQRRRLLP